MIQAYIIGEKTARQGKTKENMVRPINQKLFIKKGTKMTQKVNTAKLSGLLFILVFLLAGTYLNAQAMGDVNFDDSIDIVDSFLIASYYVGVTLDTFNPEVADVNCDNSINIIDSLLVAQYYVGQISAFPCSTPEPIETPTPLAETPGFTEELLLRWGLGTPLTEYFETKRDYPWYMDQYGTGQFGSINCGPTSVTMALKWADASFDKTPEDARNTYRPEGGWWYTSDIINYLNLYNTPNSTIRMENNPALLINQLKADNILILCVTMENMPYNSVLTEHTQSFYTNVTGHFIVIKGYVYIGETLYFESYDPFSMNKFYPAPEEYWKKGEDRYYLWKDLYQAINTWWNYAIIVSRPLNETSDSSKPNLNLLQRIADPAAIYVDPATIPHMSGAGPLDF